MSYHEMEILRLSAENAALLKALKPFAAGYDTPKFRNAAVKAVASAEKTR